MIISIKIGQKFEYGLTPHEIIEITDKHVVTERLDEFAKGQKVKWDRRGLQFLFDNAKNSHIVALEN